MPVGALGGKKNPKKLKALRAANGAGNENAAPSDNYELWVNEDMTNVSYWILENGERLGLKGDKLNSEIRKYVMISLMLLILQIFYTFIIILEWFKSVVDTHQVHLAFKEEDNL